MLSYIITVYKFVTTFSVRSMNCVPTSTLHIFFNNIEPAAASRRHYNLMENICYVGDVLSVNKKVAPILTQPFIYDYFCFSDNNRLRNRNVRHHSGHDRNHSRNHAEAEALQV